MRKLLYLLMFTFIGISCKNFNVPLSFDYGSVENGVYDNTFFKFKFPVNDDWYVLNEDEAKAIYKLGNDYASGNNKSLKKILDASQIKVAKLFTAFKTKPGTSYDFNPSILINAENLNLTPLVKTTSQYVVQTKKTISQTAMQINYVEEKENVRIGSQNFYYTKLLNSINGAVINQDYFVTIKNEFALSIILSYTTEEDKILLYNMFDNLKI